MQIWMIHSYFGFFSYYMGFLLNTVLYHLLNKESKKDKWEYYEHFYFIENLVKSCFRIRLIFVKDIPDIIRFNYI